MNKYAFYKREQPIIYYYAFRNCKFSLSIALNVHKNIYMLNILVIMLNILANKGIFNMLKNAM